MKTQIPIITSGLMFALYLGAGATIASAQAPGGPPGRGGRGGFGPGNLLAAQMIEQGDKNSDHQLTREELGGLADAWFDRLDTDHTGRLTQEKFSSGFGELLTASPGARGGQAPQRGGFGAFLGGGLFTAVDTDKDGKVDKAECRKAFEKWATDFDSNKKGSLDQETLAAGLNGVMPRPRFGGRPARDLDPGKVFTRPAESPGLGQPMKLPSPDADGFVAMFNGRDLTGWDALPHFWSIKDGLIDCVETGDEGGNVQSDLIWLDSVNHPEKYANFEFHVSVRWLSHSGNSGIQFRSVIDQADTKHVGGYQADTDPANMFTGGIYDERGQTGRREKNIPGPHMAPRGYKIHYPSDGSAGQGDALAENEQALMSVVKPVGEWNDFVVIANGSHIVFKINGHVFSDMIDENPHARRDGIIAFQQHAGAQMEIQYKDPKIRLLP